MQYSSILFLIILTSLQLYLNHNYILCVLFECELNLKVVSDLFIYHILVISNNTNNSKLL